MTDFEKRREVGKMLTSQRLKMGLTNLAFERYNNLPKCMSYRFEKGYSLSGKYAESIKRMYLLDSEQIKFFDSFNQYKKGFQSMLRQMRNARIELIYIKVTDDKFKLPLCLGESMQELSLKTKCGLPTISKGITRFMNGYDSCYEVTLEPVCEDDEIEEQRLKAFFKGDVIECIKLTRKGQRLAKTEMGCIDYEQ